VKAVTSWEGPCRLDVYLWSCGVQPGQDAKSDGGSRIKAGGVPGQWVGQDAIGMANPLP
jgi:hypothetical protein